MQLYMSCAVPLLCIGPLASQIKSDHVREGLHACMIASVGVISVAWHVCNAHKRGATAADADVIGSASRLRVGPINGIQLKLGYG